MFPPCVVCTGGAVGLSFRCPFFFKRPAPTEIYTLSLHDALPISRRLPDLTCPSDVASSVNATWICPRSEEHTSELQSHSDLVCRLLLEKKKRPARSGRSRRSDR